MTFKTLVRIYLPVLLSFLAFMVPAVVITDIVTGPIGHSDPVPGGFWLLIVGSATKYWLLIVGILLATMQLRVFVANGVTRRDFTTGAARFGLVAAVALAVLVVGGHAVESAVVTGGLTDVHPPAEFLRQLSGLLAFGVGG